MSDFLVGSDRTNCLVWLLGSFWTAQGI